MPHFRRHRQSSCFSVLMTWLACDLICVGKMSPRTKLTLLTRLVRMFYLKLAWPWLGILIVRSW